MKILPIFIFLMVVPSIHAQISEVSPQNTSDRNVMVRWPDRLPDFIQEGLNQSKETGKPILLDFSAKWCGPCKHMDRKVFPHPRVAGELDNWIFIKVDRDKYPDLARSFNVTALPSFFLLSKDQEIMSKSVGLQVPFDFVDWLTLNRNRESDAVMVSE